MDEITLMLVICAIGLFIVSYVLKKDRAISWLTFFVSICSIGQTIMDDSLEELQTMMLIVPVFYVFMISGLNAFFNNKVV